MKHIILLTLLLATCQMAFCQFFSNTDIPELNRKFVSIIDTLIGKKVGKGICYELIFKVINDSGIKAPLKKRQWGKWMQPYWNETINIYVNDSIIYPGDIIIFNNHVAIIYEVLSPEKCRIAHQNFSGRLKYSHVGLKDIDINDHKIEWITWRRVKTSITIGRISIPLQTYETEQDS